MERKDSEAVEDKVEITEKCATKALAEYVDKKLNSYANNTNLEDDNVIKKLDHADPKNPWYKDFSNLGDSYFEVREKDILLKNLKRIAEQELEKLNNLNSIPETHNFERGCYKINPFYLTNMISNFLTKYIGFRINKKNIEMIKDHLTKFFSSKGLDTISIDAKSKWDTLSYWEKFKHMIFKRKQMKDLKSIFQLNCYIQKHPPLEQFSITLGQGGENLLNPSEGIYNSP